MPTDDSDKMVNHPPHYNKGNVECIDAIIAATGDGAEHYLQGNIIKYIWRYKHRHGLQDLKKAQWYLNSLIELLTVESNLSDVKEIDAQEEALYNEMSENWDQWGNKDDESLKKIYKHSLNAWREFRLKYADIWQPKNRPETGACSYTPNKNWVCRHKNHEQY